MGDHDGEVLMVRKYDSLNYESSLQQKAGTFSHTTAKKKKKEFQHKWALNSEIYPPPVQPPVAI